MSWPSQFSGHVTFLTLRNFCEPDDWDEPEWPQSYLGGELSERGLFGGFVATRTGPWHELMPLHMDGSTESDGMVSSTRAGPQIRPANSRDTPSIEGIQCEYFCDLSRAEEIMRTTWAVVKTWEVKYAENSPNGFPGGQPFTNGGGTELRVIRGDNRWTSPHGGRDTLSVHITVGTRFDMVRVIECCEELEAALHGVDPSMRPHWGKVHHMGPERIRQLYSDEQLDKFRELCKAHDPDAKFRNEYVNSLLWDADAQEGDHLEWALEVAPEEPAEVAEAVGSAD